MFSRIETDTSGTTVLTQTKCWASAGETSPPLFQSIAEHRMPAGPFSPSHHFICVTWEDLKTVEILFSSKPLRNLLGALQNIQCSFPTFPRSYIPFKALCITPLGYFRPAVPPENLQIAMLHLAKHHVLCLSALKTLAAR